MSSRFNGLVKEFGVMEGIQLYSRVKIKKSGWIYLQGYKSRFYLRPHTTDMETFEQVFIKAQYKKNLTFIPQTIIDAGANIGLASIYFSQKFPNAKVIAIEPDKGNFDLLERNTSSWENIKPLNMGLWNTDTHVEIINSDAIKNSFMVIESGEAIDAIPAISLKSILLQNQWETLDILKMDIEGSEKEVFEKNTDYWLPKTKILFVEPHDRMRKGSSKAIFKATSQYNFSFDTIDENLVFINEDLVNDH